MCLPRERREAHALHFQDEMKSWKLSIIEILCGLTLGSSSFAWVEVAPLAPTQRATYQLEGKEVPLFLTDEGTLFYKDELGRLIEPPLHVVGEWYQLRRQEQSEGKMLTPARTAFLNNRRYQSFFGKEGISAPGLVPNQGFLFEEKVNPQTQVRKLSNGRLVVGEKETVNGKKETLYRAVHPKSLHDLQARYPKMRWSEEDARAAKYLQDLTQKLQTSPTVPHITPLFSDSGSSHSTEEKSSYPSWVESRKRVKFKRLAKEYPYPTEEISFSDLPEEYGKIRRRLDRAGVDLMRMYALGVPDTEIQKEKEKMLEDADRLQKFWASHKITSKQRALYKKDLNDFEFISIGFRFNRIYAQMLEKKVQDHRNKTGVQPFLKVRSNGRLEVDLLNAPDLSSQEEEEAKTLAVKELIASAESDPAYSRLVLQRLWELAPKHPKLAGGLKDAVPFFNTFQNVWTK